ncbi:EF-hand domain-containing protein [Maridesulfovibrio frigidus]|uniref:EF-hand domain-containing protein n=1 Tax=Maridesulfovibrio frigidus TaxID=340956 RepID=UPI0004E27DC6|nr:EF-hand domain-containing protein [Maridesulfovibrio frigidus]
MSISGVGSYMSSEMSSEMMSKMRESREGGSKEDFVSSIFGDNDGDGNGLLSLEESGMGEDMFASVDTDGDSQVSEEEVLADMEKRHEEKALMGELSVMMQGGGSGEQSDLLDSFMDELDLDGDSLISMEESGLSEELFSVLDGDGDGNISGEELEASTAPPPPPPPAEDSSDVTASSEVTASSASSTSESESETEYDEYDLNQDGVVSSEELRQAFIDGDQSLAGVFGQNESQGAENTGATSQSDGADGQSPLTRMAMRAYQEQNNEAYTGSQGAVV